MTQFAQTHHHGAVARRWGPWSIVKAVLVVVALGAAFVSRWRAVYDHGDGLAFPTMLAALALAQIIEIGQRLWMRHSARRLSQ